MEKTKTNLSLGEAAKIADCSRDTIRRAAQRQELPAKMGPGKRGNQWWVREADLLDWIQQRNESSSAAPQQSTAMPQAEHSSTAASVDSTSDNVIEDAVYKFTSPSTTAKDEDAQQSKACSAEQAECVEEVFDYDAKVISADVHQSVISELVEELRRSDRQMIALQMQLSQNTNLLAEKSESLLQQEAEEKAQAERNEELELQLKKAQQAEHELKQARQEAQQSHAELAVLRAELEKQKELMNAPFWKRWFLKGE